MNGGSGRSSLGSESPLISMSKPNQMRDTINGQRATIAKLFEQGIIDCTFYMRCTGHVAVSFNAWVNLEAILYFDRDYSMQRIVSTIPRQSYKFSIIDIDYECLVMSLGVVRP